MIPAWTAATRRRFARRDPSRRHSGFSLIELVVVMAMLAMITGMVVPVYNASLSAIQLRNARNNIVSLITYVQERAVSDTREYRLYFNDKNNTYWVMSRAQSEGAGDKRNKRGSRDMDKFEPVTAEYGRVTTLPSYMKMEKIKAKKDRDSNIWYIACFSNGACDQAELTFRDTRSAKRRFTVLTHGVMGKVEIEVPKR